MPTVNPFLLLFIAVYLAICFNLVASQKPNASDLDPCQRQQFLSKCFDAANGTESGRSQFVLRFYRRGSECVSYPYGHCPNDEKEPKLYKYKTECEEACVQKKGTTPQAVARQQGEAIEGLIDVSPPPSTGKTPPSEAPQQAAAAKTTSVAAPPGDPQPTDDFWSAQGPAVSLTGPPGRNIGAPSGFDLAPGLSSEIQGLTMPEIIQQQQLNCDAPADPGTCVNYSPRWRFDKAKQACIQFQYGGCGGNSNNFASKADCQTKCGAAQQSGQSICPRSSILQDFNGQQVRCQQGVADCPPGYQCTATHVCCSLLVEDTNNVAGALKTNSAPARCLLPKARGECTNFQPRFYFDDYNQDCRLFLYGGCGGNQNQFSTAEECAQFCKEAPSTVQLGEVKGSGAPAPPIIEGSFGNFNVRLPTTTSPPEPTTPAVAAPAPKAANLWQEKFDESAKEAHAEDELPPLQPSNLIQALLPQAGPPASPYGRAPSVPINFGPRIYVDPDNICTFPKDVGSCNRRMPRWYYSMVHQACMPFEWGGCGGNKNNFVSQPLCESACRTRREPDTTAQANASTVALTTTSVPTPAVEELSLYSNDAPAANNPQLVIKMADAPLEAPVEREAPKEASPGSVASPSTSSAPGVSNSGIDASGPPPAASLFAATPHLNGSTISFPASSIPEQPTTICPVVSKDNCPDPCIVATSAKGGCQKCICSAAGGEAFVVPISEPTTPPLPRSPPAPKANLTELAKHAKEERLSDFVPNVASPRLQVTKYAKCLEPKDAGECQNYTTRYFFNTQTIRCEGFTYTGCGGNRNHFYTVYQCRQHCDDELIFQLSGGTTSTVATTPEPLVSLPPQVSIPTFADPFASIAAERSRNQGFSSAPLTIGSPEAISPSGQPPVAAAVISEPQAVPQLPQVTAAPLPQASAPPPAAAPEDIRQRFAVPPPVPAAEVPVVPATAAPLAAIQPQQIPPAGPANPPQAPPPPPAPQLPPQAPPPAVEEVPPVLGAQPQQVPLAQPQPQQPPLQPQAQQVPPPLQPGQPQPQVSLSQDQPPQTQEKPAIDPCTQNADPGPCNTDFVNRWFYNSKRGQCEVFQYGLCGGNLNNFDSQELCTARCAPAFVSLGITLPPNCASPKDQGTCTGYNPRFYFNARNLKCEQFIWSGCGGNANQYVTKEDCEAVCPVLGSDGIAKPRAQPNPNPAPGQPNQPPQQGAPPQQGGQQIFGPPLNAGVIQPPPQQQAQFPPPIQGSAAPAPQGQTAPGALRFGALGQPQLQQLQQPAQPPPQQQGQSPLQGPHQFQQFPQQQRQFPPQGQQQGPPFGFQGPVPQPQSQSHRAPQCPNGIEPRRLADLQIMFCLPGRNQCPQDSSCFFTGTDFICCPTVADGISENLPRLQGFAGGFDGNQLPQQAAFGQQPGFGSPPQPQGQPVPFPQQQKRRQRG